MPAFVLFSINLQEQVRCSPMRPSSKTLLHTWRFLHPLRFLHSSATSHYNVQVRFPHDLPVAYQPFPSFDDRTQKKLLNRMDQRRCMVCVVIVLSENRFTSPQTMPRSGQSPQYGRFRGPEIPSLSTSLLRSIFECSVQTFLEKPLLKFCFNPPDGTIPPLFRKIQPAFASLLFFFHV